MASAKVERLRSLGECYATMCHTLWTAARGRCAPGVDDLRIELDCWVARVHLSESRAFAFVVLGWVRGMPLLDCLRIDGGSARLMASHHALRRRNCAGCPWLIRAALRFANTAICETSA